MPVTLTVLLVAGLAFASGTQEGGAATAGSTGNAGYAGSEAPMLARLVETGELPPLEQRLPDEPKLVNEMPESQVDYRIGTYGGTIRTVTSDVDWDADIFGLCNEPLINTPGMLGTEITGNIVKDYEVSTDQKEFTFYLTWRER
jgi:peptide/nickel transport system substrate-binding protein